MKNAVYVFVLLFFSCQKGENPNEATPKPKDKLSSLSKKDEDTTVSEDTRVKDTKQLEKSYSYGLPLDGPLRVSGTFAELRRTHFHAGIDLRTNGVEGKDVFAIDKAFVAQIKVSPYGYGKALYLQHPDGNMSVYGHLSKFSEQIESYVRTEQYRTKKNEGTFYLKPNQIKVAGREVIAKSGNTGGSAAPHLHFEIRKSSGEAINPLSYFSIEDTLKPVIKSIGIVPLDDQNERNPKVIAKSNLQNQSFSMPPGMYGVSAYWSDYFLDFNNKLGVNKVKFLTDGKLAFQIDIKDFQFHLGKYINLHTNFSLKNSIGLSFTNLYVVPGNKLPYYQGEGKILLKEGQEMKLQVLVEDENKNRDQLTFYLKGQNIPNPFKKRHVYGDHFDFGKKEKWSNKNAQFYGKKHAALEEKTVGINFDTTLDILRILPNDVPLKIPVLVKIKANNFKEEEYKFLLMGRKSGNTYESIGGYCKDGWVIAQSSSLGTFKILKDDQAPEIKNIKVVGDELFIKIKDNLSGIKDYEVKINGQWFRVYYEKKRDLLIGQLGDLQLNQNLRVEVSVTDNKFNKTVNKKNLIWQH